MVAVDITCEENCSCAGRFKLKIVPMGKAAFVERFLKGLPGTLLSSCTARLISCKMKCFISSVFSGDFRGESCGGPSFCRIAMTGWFSGVWPMTTAGKDSGLWLIRMRGLLSRIGIRFGVKFSKLSRRSEGAVKWIG